MFAIQAKFTALSQEIREAETLLGRLDEDASELISGLALAEASEAVDAAEATAEVTAAPHMPDEVECPVCRTQPTSGIFGCRSHGHMVCGVCKDSLEHCPQCEDDFKARPPTRKGLMERHFGIKQ